jgi:molecular chaperone DnaJ
MNLPHNGIDSMNFYDILGIKQTSSQEEVKTAFRAKALQYHPDRNPNNKQAEETFKEVNAAYEILGDPQKRSRYDEQLNQSTSFRRQRFTSPEEMFASLFGNFPTAASINIPRHQTNVTLTLAETLKNQEKIAAISLKSKCSKCLGTAIGKGERCKTCQGNGCNTCGGLGICYPKCDLCNGAGFFAEQKEVKIEIPKGLFSKTQLSVNTQYGVVLVNITIQSPENIKLGAGGRLIMNVPIPYHIAILGGTYPVTMIEGSAVNVKFPPLTKNEQLIKIKGKGLYAGPNAQERGDLFLSTFIAIPENISEEYKTIVDQLANLYSREESNKQ